jgi:hypothetical protein
MMTMKGIRRRLSSTMQRGSFDFLVDTKTCSDLVVYFYLHIFLSTMALLRKLTQVPNFLFSVMIVQVLLIPSLIINNSISPFHILLIYSCIMYINIVSKISFHFNLSLMACVDLVNMSHFMVIT